MATMRGEAVDRPPVSFYEINGLDENPENSDPHNIYSDPSWKSLIDLTREKTDRIVMRDVPLREQASAGTDSPAMVGVPTNPLERLMERESWEDVSGSRFVRRSLAVAGRKLTNVTRHDRDVNTVWTVEHFLKDTDDLRALLELPFPEFEGEPDLSGVQSAEEALGDTGIVMIDTPDPLCLAAELFDMGTYTMVAMMEQPLFHQLLERFAAILQRKTEAVAKLAPGRLWRIYGPEFASVPYLSPALFREYVVRYDKPMVEAIQRHGGFCRLHSHGNLKTIIEDIVSTGCMGLDPIEPPPQGDVTLEWMREHYGRELVLFGNLEISDIENLPTNELEPKIHQALDEGTRGEGRGFVLMPSACPYGRRLGEQTLRNYEKIIEIVEQM